MARLAPLCSARMTAEAYISAVSEQQLSVGLLRSMEH